MRESSIFLFLSWQTTERPLFKGKVPQLILLPIVAKTKKKALKENVPVFV